MKTSDEIVKALRGTATVQTGDEPCESCPFNRTETLTEAQKAQLHCEEWHRCDVDGSALAAADLIERLEKEKAALLECVKLRCDLCKNFSGSGRRKRCWVTWVCSECNIEECSCRGCDAGSKWEWKGLAPKEPEVRKDGRNENS